MELDLTAAPIAAGVAAAVAMGYAIQSGGTCMVAAIGELAERRRAGKLLALLEAALWVSGGLMLAEALRMTLLRPAPYAPGLMSLVGGALIGVGAVVNGACAIGTIARLGSGETAFVLTPAGYFAGSALLGRLPARLAPVRAEATDVGLPIAILAVLAGYAAWRLLSVLRTRRARPEPGEGHAWTPHEATLVIALAFIVLFLAVGPWSWTDLAVDLARGRAGGLALRVGLFAALLAGAGLGGFHAGRWRAPRLELRQALACLTGGGLMAVGGALAPGGNDGLLLIGAPLLYPYAWAALMAMSLAILASLRVKGALRGSGR